jgi:hypothetical protein
MMARAISDLGCLKAIAIPAHMSTNEVFEQYKCVRLKTAPKGKKKDVKRA